MKFTVSHNYLSTALHCHAIWHASHFTVVNCDTATIDVNKSFIIISILLKAYILDIYVTRIAFKREFIIVTATD